MTQNSQLSNLGQFLTVTTSNGTVSFNSNVVLTSNVAFNQSLTVNNEIVAGNGFYSNSTFANIIPYVDGIVMDYTNGMGRISVGAGDGITLYTGGVATSPVLSVNSTGIYTGVVNASSYSIGTSFTANATGVYTGFVNTVSLSSGSFSANSTGAYAGVVNASSINATSVNAASHTVGSSTVANSTGVYTGVVNATSVNAVSYTVGTSFVANSSGVYDSIGPIRNLPLNSQTSSYTLQASDSGKMIDITTGGVTVPASIFTSGQNVTIYNDSSANQTITAASGVTMYQAGTSNTGNRTLAQRGVATVFCVAANTFVIGGAGIS